MREVQSLREDVRAQRRAQDHPPALADAPRTQPAAPRPPAPTSAAEASRIGPLNASARSRFR